jgi:methionine-S-sulfoxide reductase
MRYCLNSASLEFTPSDQLASLADPAAAAAAAVASAQATDGAATAVLAGGCFWCTEAAFAQLDGVIDVESGYCGGSEADANYETVCSGRTGHAEAIRITYDPARITYDKLLDVFFDAHDPTQLNRQDNDVGTQYRSAIFYGDDTQLRAAREKIERLTADKAYTDPIVTTLEPLTEFFPAEEYHQDYAKRNPFQPYVQYHSIPKMCKIREKYSELVRSAE